MRLGYRFQFHNRCFVQCFDRILNLSKSVLVVLFAKVFFEELKNLVFNQMLVLVSGAGYCWLFTLLLLLMIAILFTLIVREYIHYTRFNVVKKFACSFCYDSKELAVVCSLITTYLYSAIPNTNYHHDVSYVHLLKYSKKFFASTIFSVIVKTLSQYFFLLNRVDLVNSISHDFAFGRCKLAASLLVAYV